MRDGHLRSARWNDAATPTKRAEAASRVGAACSRGGKNLGCEPAPNPKNYLELGFGQFEIALKLPQ
jgi:hypothetical protein